MPWSTLQSPGSLSHFLPPQWYSDISSPVKFQIQSNRRQRVNISSKNFLMFPCPWWPTFPPPAKALLSFLSYLFYFLLQLYPSPLFVAYNITLECRSTEPRVLHLWATVRCSSKFWICSGVSFFYSQYLRFVLCFMPLTESLLLGNPAKDAYACTQQSPCL